MDPHKRSVTIEVMRGDEAVLGGGRFATDAAGYAELLRYLQEWPERVWAIEGCQGIGRHIANRLLKDGEQVVDVPPKLSARVRGSPVSSPVGQASTASGMPHPGPVLGTRRASITPTWGGVGARLLIPGSSR